MLFKVKVENERGESVQIQYRIFVSSRDKGALKTSVPHTKLINVSGELISSRRVSDTDWLNEVL